MSTKLHTGKPSAKRRRLPRAERERQIIGVAENVFARRGFDGASIEEIAREAGVDRALLYHYFETKEGLYKACLKISLEELRERVLSVWLGMESAADDAERIAIVRRSLRAFFEFVQDRGAAWDVLFGSGYSSIDVRGKDRPDHDQMIVFLARLIDEGVPGIPDGQRHASAAAMLGAGWALSLWWRNDPEMPIDEVVSLYLKFTLGALTPLIVAAREGR